VKGYAPERSRNSERAFFRISWFVVRRIARRVLKRTYVWPSTLTVRATGFVSFASVARLEDDTDTRLAVLLGIWFPRNASIGVFT
jgi:hypothetical protein